MSICKVNKTNGNFGLVQSRQAEVGWNKGTL